MNKTELAAKLGACGIEFSRDATVAELRKLFAENIDKIVPKANEGADTKQKDKVSSDSDSEALRNNSVPTQEKPLDETKKSVDANSDKIEDDDAAQKELNDALLNLPKSKAAIQLHDIELEEELLEAKIRLLEKKKRLSELESSVFTPITQHFLKPNYKDIKHLVPLFSGTDDYDARKWLGDFERACDVTQ